MTLFLLSSLSAMLCISGLIVLRKHRANVRHHNFRMGMIGSDARLTETLHQRLCHRQPQTDWLNPHVMRGKINRELRTANREPS